METGGGNLSGFFASDGLVLSHAYASIDILSRVS